MNYLSSLRKFHISDMIPPVRPSLSIFYIFLFMIIGGILLVKLVQSIDPAYQESFETATGGSYIPEQNRGKLPRLEEVDISDIADIADIASKQNPQPNTPPLATYGDWENLQRKFRDASAVTGSTDFARQKPLVTDNLRWRIHRWTLWDYLPDLDTAYYCRAMQRNGSEECVPLTQKQYCSVGNLYKTAGDCIQGLNREYTGESTNTNSSR